MEFIDAPNNNNDQNEIGTPVVIVQPQQQQPHVDPNDDFGFIDNRNTNGGSNGTSPTTGPSSTTTTSNNNSNNAAAAIATPAVIVNNNNNFSANNELPTRPDIRTQEQLMADSIAIIEARGQAKFNELQAKIRQRIYEQDARSTELVQRMEADAAAEIRAHVVARDEAVAAAKKTHAESQKKLLSEMANLEKQGNTWELAASHCDLGKPNSRATKSTDKMRKTLTTLVTEPNVAIGVGSN